MKASIAEQLVLIDVALLDSELNKIQNQAKNHPKRDEILQLKNEAEQNRFENTALDTSISDLQKEANKFENEIDLIKTRIAKDKSRIDQATNAKELAATEHEIEALNARQFELENQELQLLEQIEEKQKRKESFNNRTTILESEIEALSRELKTELYDLKAQAESSHQKRIELVKKISEVLLEKYKKIQIEHSGLAAARLENGSCAGCNIRFSPIEVQEMKAQDPELILTCENCGCILVRA